jgi:hypothetical protein
MGVAAAAGRLLAAVDWEREAYPAYRDFFALPLFAVFFLVVRYLLDCFVFEVNLLLLTCWVRKAAKLLFCWCVCVFPSSSPGWISRWRNHQPIRSRWIAS